MLSLLKTRELSNFFVTTVFFFRHIIKITIMSGGGHLAALLKEPKKTKHVEELYVIKRDLIQKK